MPSLSLVEQLLRDKSNLSGPALANAKRLIKKYVDDLAAVLKRQVFSTKSGKIDRATRMEIDSLKSSEADLEGSNRWYAVIARGASGKDIRQLFERQGVLVSRILRVSMGVVKLDKSLSRGQFRQLESEEVSGLLKPKAAEDADDK